MPTLPNFFIIGAAKSGTTALFSYLGQHPQVFACPAKEPRFFAHENKAPDWAGPGDDRYRSTTVTDIATYLALFHDAAGEKAVGEASTQYLYLPKARERIKYYVPGARLIAILRNPLEVAYSAYMHKRRDGLEPCGDFGRALEEEETRIRENWSPMWHYRQRGFYYKHLDAYFRTFDREQIRVYLYDDFVEKPAHLLQDVFKFLEVDDTFVPDMSHRPNVSGIPRSQSVQRFLTEPNAARGALKSFLPDKAYQWGVELLRGVNLGRPALPEQVKRQLAEDYREDVMKLQDLLRRDLTKWLCQSV